MNRQNDELDNAEIAELREYYDFDYRSAKPNRFAARIGEEQLMVVLDADMAAIFPTSEAVNEALRVLASVAQKLPGVESEARADVLAELPAGTVVSVEEPVAGN